MREQRHNKLSIYWFKYAVYTDRFWGCIHSHTHTNARTHTHTAMSQCIGTLGCFRLGLGSTSHPKQNTADDAEWTRNERRERKNNIPLTYIRQDARRQSSCVIKTHKITFEVAYARLHMQGISCRVCDDSPATTFTFAWKAVKTMQ